MLPPGQYRGTSPPRLPPEQPRLARGLPEEMALGNPMRIDMDMANVVQLQEELKHKDAVLKQLEVQFDLYKEEHAKLLASKLEEQREAFNLEKDRINQHFIRTGQELHGRTEELHTHQQDYLKLQEDNKNLKEWLDKGVEECCRVAEENEKIKNELWEVKSSLNRSDADLTQRVAAAELEAEKERSEKDAAHSALQSLQDKIRDLELVSEEDRRNFIEVSTQARRMKRRVCQLKLAVDRVTGERPHDPLLALDDTELLALDDLDAPAVVADRQAARDSLFHLHEALNNLQTSCKKLLTDGAHGGGLGVEYATINGGNTENAVFPLRQQVEMLAAENEGLQAKMKRKQDEVEEMGEEMAHFKRRIDQQRAELEEELEKCRRAKNQVTMECDQARNEAARLQDELEQSRMTLTRMAEQDELAGRRASDLEDELRKLTQELSQIRDYGIQLEQTNEQLQRKLASEKEAEEQASVVTGNLVSQLQQQLKDQQDQYQKLQEQFQQLNERLMEQQQQQQQQPHQPPPQPSTPAAGVPHQQHSVPVPGLSVGSIHPPVQHLPPQPPPQQHQRMVWPSDPDDYGHASPAHLKLSCPLCNTPGFIPGIPCRHCGHSIGQFTKFAPSTRGQSATPRHHLPQPPNVSPRRWHG